MPFILGRDPTAKIIVVCYGDDLATHTAHEIRTMMQSKWYREVFDTRLAKDRFRVTDFATTKGGGVFAVSIGGGITGRGADYIIVDDPLEIKDADNPDRLRFGNERFENVIRNRLDDSKNGCIVVLGHRLNENDLSGHVLAEHGWKHVCLQFIATSDSTFDVGHGIWPRKKGELLRPNAFTPREVQRIQSSANFQTLYQQDAAGTGLLPIRQADFLLVTPAAVPNAGHVVSVDPGQGDGMTNSFSVIQTWCRHVNGYFLRDQWRKRTNYRELRTACKQTIGRFRPSAVLIERASFGAALLSDINPTHWMDVVPVIPIDSKIARLREHIETIRSRRVHLPDDAPWSQEYMDEFVEFPSARFTDQVDATTQFLDYIRLHPIIPPPPTREIGARISYRRNPWGPSYPHPRFFPTTKRR